MTLADLGRAIIDPTAPIPPGWPTGAAGVLLLFCVPIGGGIPAGVLMAQSSSIRWPEMLGLYFVSDLILAVVFEPILVSGGWLLQRSAFGRRFAEAWRLTMRRTAERFGRASGPLALILVAFGVDPMTGRAAAAAAGHGFFPGWAIAITGDMLYFAVLMVSTLWLGSILGDGRSTVLVMFVLMLVLPQVLGRRARPAGPFGR